MRRLRHGRNVYTIRLEGWYRFNPDNPGNPVNRNPPIYANNANLALATSVVFGPVGKTEEMMFVGEVPKSAIVDCRRAGGQ
jgi:hypothetical protein